jgi:hypothetical protein
MPVQMPAPMVNMPPQPVQVPVYQPTFIPQCINPTVVKDNLYKYWWVPVVLLLAYLYYRQYYLKKQKKEDSSHNSSQ